MPRAINSLMKYDNLASELGITHEGKEPVKSFEKTTWKCAENHLFKATYHGLQSNSKKKKRKSNGCFRCFGSSKNYNLEQSGELARRLEPRHLCVINGWKGAKNDNDFHCYICVSEWTEIGLSVTNHNRPCPVCVPRRGGSKPLNIRPGTKRPRLPAIPESLPHPG